MIDALHITQGVEVGTFCGYFAHHLLLHSRLQLLLCVDSWEGRCAGYKAEAESLLKQFGSRVRIVKRRSVEAAASYLPRKKFGFVYLDADHRKGIYEDLEAWYPRLARPAIFSGHDYAPSKHNRVIEAVNAFAATINTPVYITREPLTTWFMILGDGSLNNGATGDENITPTFPEGG
jgi:predicted O-methyltransferase YrrM